MSVLAVAVKHLVSLGMDGDALAAVIREMEAADDTRSASAKRQQRYRERQAEREEASQSVTNRNEASHVTEASHPPSLDKESFPQTPFKEIKPIPARDARTRGARLSVDWVPQRPYPSPVAALLAKWPPGREDRELDQFRDYWTTRSRDAAKLDWDKVWHNRIRDQHDRIAKVNGHGRTNGQSASGYGRSVDAALAWVEESEPH